MNYYLLAQWWRFLVRIISPSFCEHCRTFLYDPTVYCVTCMDQIKPIVTHSVSLSKKYQILLYAVSAYREPIRQLIIAKSYSNRLASTQLAQLMWERTVISQRVFDCIIPIPLHWTRYAYRGYNQATVIAQYLSTKSGKPVLHALKRVRKTPLLSEVSSKKRSQVMENVFAVLKAEAITGKHILLVDDVCTTGVTLREAAKVLAPYKPASIQAIVAARVV